MTLVYDHLLKLYTMYEDLFKVNISEYSSGAKKLVFPIIPEGILAQIIRTVSNIFMREPVIIRKNFPCIILGDIHGHILDLLRVFKEFGPPPKHNYVILGDMVDRGEFSLETITLVFVLKALYPENVILIRGNHEFREMNATGGFAAQVNQMYDRLDIFEMFNEAFNNLSIAAVIYDKIFCVHGGIGWTFTSLEQLERLQKPIESFADGPVMSAVWSDPSTTVTEGFEQSTRGIGYFYAEDVLNNFLNDHNLELLVRGHESCDGIKPMFDGKVVTVFGASNYCNTDVNNSGVLEIGSSHSDRTVKTFPPIKYIRRIDTIFLYSDAHDILQFNPRNRKIMDEWNPAIRDLEEPQPNSTRKLAKNRLTQSTPALLSEKSNGGLSMFPPVKKNYIGTPTKNSFVQRQIESLNTRTTKSATRSSKRRNSFDV